MFHSYRFSSPLCFSFLIVSSIRLALLRPLLLFLFFRSTSAPFSFLLFSTATLLFLFCFSSAVLSLYCIQSRIECGRESFGFDAFVSLPKLRLQLLELINNLRTCLTEKCYSIQKKKKTFIPAIASFCFFIFVVVVVFYLSSGFLLKRVECIPVRMRTRQKRSDQQSIPV